MIDSICCKGDNLAARLLMTEFHARWQVTGSNGFNQTYSTPITGGTYRQVISAPGAPGSYSVVSRLVLAFSFSRLCQSPILDWLSQSPFSEYESRTWHSQLHTSLSIMFCLSWPLCAA